jgi:hypothetical protein
MRLAYCSPALRFLSLLAEPRPRKPVQNAKVESFNGQLLLSMPGASRQFPSLKWPWREDPADGENPGLDKTWGKVPGSQSLGVHHA